MRRATLIFVAAAAVGFCAEPAPGARFAEAATALQQAVAAYRAGDVAAFREHMITANAARTDHPTYVYYLAAAHALNGDAAGAAAALETLARWGLHRTIDGQADFEAVRADPAFAAAAAALEANLAPQGAAPLAFSLPANGGLWEGVAHDPTTNRTFLSDLHRGEVWVRHEDGRLTLFARSAEAGYGCGGLAVDALRGRLWVSSPAMPEVLGWTESLAGRSRLLAFDLHTGERQNVIALDDQDAATTHTVADVSVAPDGTVYAADSTTPIIWRVLPGVNEATAFATITAPGERHSLQSCAITADGKWLFVSDYSAGLHRVDTATGEAVWLAAAPDDCLLGLDGFARSGDTLLAAQNGVSPRRLLRFELIPADASGRPPQLGRPTVVAAALPQLTDPTLITPTPAGFLVIGDAGWKHFGEQAEADSTTREVAVLRIAR